MASEEDVLRDIKRLRLIEIEHNPNDTLQMFHRAAVAAVLTNIRNITVTPHLTSAVLYIKDGEPEDVQIRKYWNTMQGLKVDETGEPVTDAEGRMIDLDAPITLQ